MRAGDVCTTHVMTEGASVTAKERRAVAEEVDFTPSPGVKEVQRLV